MDRPDRWVVLEMKEKNEDAYYKLFLTWIGGYIDADKWRMNSGITEIKERGNFIIFHGYSGSIYECSKSSYGTSIYSDAVLDNMIKNAYKVDVQIDIMPETTDWLNLLN